MKMSAKQNGLYSMMEPFLSKLRQLKKSKSLTYGLPFFVFVIGGSFGLREWTSIRYQFAQVKGVSPAELEKMGLKKDKEVTLETAFEEIQSLDIDNWENKRGPRPWEEPDKKK